MTNAFGKYISGQVSAPSKLPYLHTTDGFALRDIISLQRLEPSPCSVFGDSLVYFFLGRPSYRTNPGVNPNCLSSLFPISLIFRRFLTPSPKRLFPFDTGAFVKRLYDSFLHNRMELKDFELNPCIDSADRLIGVFWGNDKAYFDGAPHVTFNPPPTEFEIESYYQMVCSKSKNSFDDRISAIEIQYNVPINIDSSMIQAIVLPACFLDNKSMFTTIVQKWGCVPLTYEVGRMRPTEYIGLMFEIIRRFYKNEGIF